MWFLGRANLLSGDQHFRPQRPDPPDGLVATKGVLLAANISPACAGVLEMIGNTPMVEVTRLDTGPCRLFLKT